MIIRGFQHVVQMSFDEFRTGTGCGSSTGLIAKPAARFVDPATGENLAKHVAPFAMFQHPAVNPFQKVVAANGNSPTRAAAALTDAAQFKSTREMLTALGITFGQGRTEATIKVSYSRLDRVTRSGSQRNWDIYQVKDQNQIDVGQNTTGFFHADSTYQDFSTKHKVTDADLLAEEAPGGQPTSLLSFINSLYANDGRQNWGNVDHIYLPKVIEDGTPNGGGSQFANPKDIEAFELVVGGGQQRK